jgi:hypothetical protein
MIMPTSRSRAGRTDTITGSLVRSTLPRAATSRRGQPLRRRAALSQSGHSVSEVSGFDGEVCVRYESVFKRAEPAAGERRLLLAVLEDGIRTLLKNARATHGRGFNLRREALGWLTTAERADVFTFENICETLGIDAARLRERVLTEAGHGGQPVH